MSESFHKLCWEDYKAVSALNFRSQVYHQKSCCEVHWKQKKNIIDLKLQQQTLNVLLDRRFVECL